MKIIGMIPARGGSTRYNNKPLADICGRPMVYWVWKHSKEVSCFEEVYVATDSEEIRAVAESFGAKVLMTSSDCETATERLYEVSKMVEADLYVMVNGDEPLIDPDLVDRVVPDSLEGFFAANLMAPIHSPVEAVDETNIKVVADQGGNALFFSRSPIPHPKASVEYQFYKHLGVLCYTREALEFFDQTPRGPLESIEDINELRFIEHGRKLKMIPVEAKTLSVDTPKDLEYVRGVLRQKVDRGEI